MKKENITYPDDWNGWKIIEKNRKSEIDYSINDSNYLSRRYDYLLENVINDQSDKLYKSLDSYSNRQILAWGCGSGKTTNLKVLCAKTDKSVLIVVKTNEEIQKLVFDIKALNPEQLVCGVYQGCEVLDKLEFNPNILSQYKIVITNNWRALYESSDIFMNYFDSNVNKLIRREVVIFDEFQNPYSDIIVNSEVLIYELYMKKMINEHTISFDDETIKYIIKFDKNMSRNIFSGLPEIRNSKLHEERLKKLYDKLGKELRKESNIPLSRDIVIYQDINEFISDNTKIIILDATANILFKNCNGWNIEEYNQRSIKLEDSIYFDFLNSKRKTRKTEKIHNSDILKDLEKINKYVTESKREKHLIVTWKNTNYIPDLPSFIKSNLDPKIKKKCDVVYYNSGECRATNEYMTCDSIIFFGEWFNNRHHTERLSEVLKCQISAKDLVVTELIQAIFRTRARLDQPISIAFFYNFNKSLMEQTDSFEESICNLLEPNNQELKNMIIMRRILMIAEEDLNKKTFEKLCLYQKAFNIKNISNSKTTISIEFQSLIKELGCTFRSRRDVIPLKEALLKYFNIELILK